GPEAGSGGQPAAISGCVDGTSCASGVCGATHDCQNCVSDRECSAGSVCSAGQCAVACNAEEGSSQACGSGLTCCSEHCVSTGSDRRNCGACETAGGDTQFCGRSCSTARSATIPPVVRSARRSSLIAPPAKPHVKYRKRWRMC